MRDQSQIARANELTKGLTDLRRLGLAGDLEAQGKGLDAWRNYGDTLYSGMSEAEQQRVKALYDAAESEEQALVGEQEGYGKALAERGDYSVLGKLYGLTDEQVGKLSHSGDGGGGYGYSGGPKEKTALDRIRRLYPNGPPKGPVYSPIGGGGTNTNTRF